MLIIANTICRALEDRALSCWIAPRDIGPGENFQEAIVRAIRAAKVMVLIFSANTNDSAEVKKEVVLASQHKLAVIPVRIEEVVPAEAFAYELSTRQWVDLFVTGEAAIARVADQIKRMLGGAVGQPTPAIPAVARPPTPAAPAKRGTPVWFIGAAVAAILLAAGGIFLFLQRPAVAPSPPQAAAPRQPAPQAPATPTVAAGELAAATRACAEAQALTGDDPPTKAKFAAALMQCSTAALQNRDVQLASRQARAALGIAERLNADAPDTREFEALLALGHARVGHVLRAIGDLPGATREYQADVALRETILRRAPNRAPPQMALSTAEVNLARALKAQGDVAGARQAFTRCIELRRSATASRPDNAEWQDLKTACETGLANLDTPDRQR